MTDNEIQLILSEGEGYRIEFKETLDKSFQEEAIAFANSPQKIYFHSSVICAIFQGSSKDTILDRKEFEGSIPENIDNAILYLKKNLRTKYIIESVKRNEQLEIPIPALREAIVNAVLHRDYFEKGANVTVEIFEDRVEISNPGGLHPAIPRMQFGKRSLLRNPNIGDLLFRMGYIEKLGTGIQRIQKVLKENDNQPAEFILEGFFTIIFFRKKIQEVLKHNYRIHQQVNKLDNQTSEQDKILNFCKEPKTKKEILEYIKLKPVYMNYKRKILPLVQEGFLELSIPEKPNSKNQKYATKKQ